MDPPRYLAPSKWQSRLLINLPISAARLTALVQVRQKCSRRIAIMRDCMKSLDRNIWHSKISTTTKIQLYNIYILSVLLYGAETWTLTTVLSAIIDSFDQWCQRRILRLHYSQHVSNHEVRRRTDCIPASEIIQSRRLKLFRGTGPS